MVFPVLRMDASRRKQYNTSAVCLLSCCGLIAMVAALNNFSLSVILSDGVAQLMYHRSLAGFMPFLSVPLLLIVAALHFWATHLIVANRHMVNIRQAPVISASLNPITMLMISLSCTVLVTTCSFYYYTTFRESISYGMLQGMTNYRSDPADKALVDGIQVQFRCCAITGYNDWLNENSTNDPLVTHLSAFSWAPSRWSRCSGGGCYFPPTCCKLNQLKCSAQITVRKNIVSKDIGELKVREWLNPQGCVSNVMDAVHSLSVILVPLLVLCIQLIAVTVAQISVTANFVAGQFHEAALELDVPLPAWILPFPGMSTEDLLQRCRKRIAENRHFDEKTFLDMTAMTKMTTTMTSMDPMGDVSKMEATEVKQPT